MPRKPIPTWTFAMVVVRRGEQFLIVRERKHGQRWFLPAGGIEPGEPLVVGAMRETLEESGVPVRIDGLLRVEHAPRAHDTWLRFVFTGTPVDDSEPGPTEDSLDARWATLEEIQRLPLRGVEVLNILQELVDGAHVMPLSASLREARWG
ncbi:MAG: NUDIX domain-containing protein [Alphaproteobacteria bacterium]|nr:NUDIX domain-containing protein [Alphaproteobacteria bacterium]